MVGQLSLELALSVSCRGRLVVRFPCPVGQMSVGEFSVGQRSVGKFSPHRFFATNFGRVNGPLGIGEQMILFKL
jgi:hypothetical protein